jgi:hypothetical protein
MNKTSQADSNVTKVVGVALNNTSHQDSKTPNNATQGADAAINQTGKVLLNVGDSVMLGVKNLFDGSDGGNNNGQK